MLSADANEFIYGKVFKMTDAVAVLKVLDDYEGFGEDQPWPNEFIRVIAEVVTGKRTLKCWMYSYNLHIDGLTQIIPANYLSHKK